MPRNAPARTRTTTDRKQAGSTTNSPAAGDKGSKPATTVVSLRVDEERLQQVRAAAAMLNSTPNAVMREGIDLWLAKFARRKDLNDLRDQFYARNAEMFESMTRLV